MRRVNPASLYVASAPHSLECADNSRSSNQHNSWVKEKIQRAVSRLVLPAQFLNHHHAIPLASSQPTFYINNNLCSVILTPKKQPNNPNNKYIIYVPASCERFENHEQYLQSLADQTGTNILTFNYRGVGTSKGKSLTIQDLIDDCDDAVNYLTQQLHIPEENILLHGHSLGGSIATATATMHPQINLCNDRSFSKLSDAAIALRPFRHFLPRFFIKYVLNKTNWDIDSVENYSHVQGHKFILYCKDDKIIHYHMASLHSHLPQSDAIELTPRKHHHDVNLDKISSFSEYIVRVKRILKIPISFC
jgi:alpha/beta superfamily hydrolase